MAIAFAEKTRNYKKYIACAILLLVFCFLVSLPILQADYFSDDATNSLIPGSFELFHVRFLQGVWNYTRDWLIAGRFFPLSVLSTVAVFYLFPDEVSYQIVRTIFIWLSLFSFAWLIKQLTKNANAGWLFVFLAPLCWSIRNFPDPLTSFAIFLPLLTLFIAMALILFLKYQATEQITWLVFSLIFYVLALSTYELSITLFFLLPIVMRFGPYANKPSWGSYIPYGMLTFIYAVINLRLRYNSSTVYNGIEIGSFTHFWSTFGAQLISSIPLSYRLFSHEPAVALADLLHPYFSQPSAFGVMGCLFGVAFFGIYYFMRKVALSRQAVFCLALLGIVLMTVPAALIAVSVKYQQMVTVGKGYIAVYLQYIGFSLLLVAALGVINQLKINKASLFLLAFLCSVILTYAWLLNSYSVSKMNDAVGHARSLLENALRHDLLAGLPAHAVMIEKLYLWNNAEFFMLNAHRKIAAVIDLNDFAAITQVKKSDLYLLETYHLPGSKSGYVILGHVDEVHTKVLKNPIRKADAIRISQPRIFISSVDKAEWDAIKQLVSVRLTLSQVDMKLISETYHKGIMTSLSKSGYMLLFS